MTPSWRDVEDPDPTDDDEDVPCPGYVCAVLGFNPDELDWGGEAEQEDVENAAHDVSGEARAADGTWTKGRAGKAAKEVKARKVKSTPKDANEAVEDILPLLSDTERDTIQRYTGGLFEPLNHAMRECPPEFECVEGRNRQHMEAMEKAIAMCAPLKKPTLVHRGIAVEQGTRDAILATALDRIADGREFTMPSLTSTSFSQEQADDGFGYEYAGKKAVHFRIVANHGLPVETLTSSPGEHELVLSGKAKYRVTKVEGNEVHLEQTHG